MSSSAGADGELKDGTEAAARVPAVVDRIGNAFNPGGYQNDEAAGEELDDATVPELVPRHGGRP